ncbi:TIGR00730 family Rossman fold protein [Catenulispora subtropica]|uniref:Cytokinin riboside 5'-monophosphate phosphoribohydrolase n=1 Tax=Catenulispora subtropica TaxID=450798 RepID=A0ABN2SKR2_9ACTN
MPTVGVFCGSNVGIGDRHLRQAASVGREAALRGYSVIVGGGLVSCMGAVAEAARHCGAHVDVIVPRVIMERSCLDDLPDDALVTDDIWEWKREIGRRADAFLVLPGGLGTLTELLEVWSGRTLGTHYKPIAVVDAEGVFAPLRDFVVRLVDLGFSRTASMNVLSWAASAAEAFDHLERHPAAEQPAG